MATDYIEQLERRLASLETRTAHLPPKFLAEITEIHPALDTEGNPAAGEGLLYATFDVIAVDENKRQIPGTEVKGILATTGLYNLIPDLLLASAPEDVEAGNNNARRRTEIKFTGQTVSSFASGDGHTHDSVDIEHSHVVYPYDTIPELQDWRLLFYTGDGNVQIENQPKYYAVVDSCLAGREIFYYIIGFIAQQQVADAPVALTSFAIAAVPEPTQPPSETVQLTYNQYNPLSLNINIERGQFRLQPGFHLNVVGGPDTYDSLRLHVTDMASIIQVLQPYRGGERRLLSYIQFVNMNVLISIDSPIYSHESGTFVTSEGLQLLATGRIPADTPVDVWEMQFDNDIPSGILQDGNNYYITFWQTPAGQ